VVLIASPIPGLAQPADGRGGGQVPLDDADQTYLFRGLLKYAGFKPISGRDQIDREIDGNTLLVLFGALDRPPQGATLTTSSLVAYTLQQGGSVLIATDQPTRLNMPFGDGLVEITGRTVLGPKPRAYLEDPGMPFLVPTKSFFPDPHLSRMTELPRVATNQPSSFGEHRSDRFTIVPIAEFPPGSRSSDGTPLANSTAGFVAIRPRSAARAVVFPDTGIFTNQMITAPGTDNLAYAYHLANLLAEGADGKKRTKCLFYENGELRSDFEDLLKTPAPPMPSLEKLQEKLVDAADRAIDVVQTRDSLGRAVANAFPHIAPVLATIVAALIALVLVRRTWAARHDPDSSPGPKTLGSDAHKTLDFRRVEILRANDVYEPLREHLRAQFARWGMPAGGPEMPPIVVSGAPPDLGRIPVRVRGTSAADVRLLTGKVRKLWEIAYGDVPVAVPFVRWKELEPMIAFVARAADAGRWRFAEPGGAA
jgi:hypothetical protein